MTPEIKQRIEQIRRGEVPEGYVKKRKVVIPQQWGLPQIKDIASISSGSTPNRNNSEYWNGNIAWGTTGELSSGHVNHTSELIIVKAVKETKMRIYPQGTLLMAMYGQGKTRGTVAILEIDAAVNQACAAITVKDGKSKFLFYQLKNSYQDIRKLSNTGNQENLNADIIKTYQVPWAPDEEQERISTILTTQDKVIELKEKRLAEKQRQKKYLMQQLLTGIGQAGLQTALAKDIDQPQLRQVLGDRTQFHHVDGMLSRDLAHRGIVLFDPMHELDCLTVHSIYGNGLQLCFTHIGTGRGIAFFRQGKI